MTIQDTDQQHQQMLLLEAALYAAGKPLTLKTLGSILGLRSKNKIRGVARHLEQRYLEYDGPLEIMELGQNMFVMQLKPQYVPQVQRLSIKPPLTKGPLKTLA